LVKWRVGGIIDGKISAQPIQKNPRSNSSEEVDALMMYIGGYPEII